MKATRGNGILEGFLAKQRQKIANRLIPFDYRKGRILDIGCGSYPVFLLKTEFFEKVGIDKTFDERTNDVCRRNNIKMIRFDIEKNEIIPMENEYFDVVTMLAVFEHIDPGKLVATLNEIFRILKSRGLFILTTPAGWTGAVLRIMAAAGLVSRIEVAEHKDTYSARKILSFFRRTNFPMDKIRYGYFEMFANLWLVAEK